MVQYNLLCAVKEGTDTQTDVKQLQFLGGRSRLIDRTVEMKQSA